jgi:hypothetical protein
VKKLGIELPGQPRIKNPPHQQKLKTSLLASTPHIPAYLPFPTHSSSSSIPSSALLTNIPNKIFFHPQNNETAASTSKKRKFPDEESQAVNN